MDVVNHNNKQPQLHTCLVQILVLVVDGGVSLSIWNILWVQVLDSRINYKQLLFLLVLGMRC